MPSTTIAAHRKSASLAEIYFDCESYLRHEPDDRVMTPAILSDIDLFPKHRASKMTAGQLFRLFVLSLMGSVVVVALVVSRFSLILCLQLGTSFFGLFIIGKSGTVIPIYSSLSCRSVYC